MGALLYLSQTAQMTALRLFESLCLSAAGKWETRLRSIGGDHSICLNPLSHRQPFTSHPILLYTLRNLFSDVEERKDLATSQSTDDAVPVEVFAESISENDPALIPIATGTGYAMTRTFGRTGRAVLRDDDGISIQFTSVERSQLAPTNRRSGICLAGIS
jgi:hypothetical protein